MKYEKKLLIVGASGHGKVVADISIKVNQWETVAFLDDDDSIQTCMDLKVIGSISDAYLYKNHAEFFVAIGNNIIREKVQEQFENQCLSIATLVHPSSILGSEVCIDKGTVIMAGTVINATTKIGKGCIVNTGTIVEHDSTINDYVHLSPGVKIAGTVKIGRRSWLGIGSVVSNNMNISCDSIVGAGSVVIKNITKPGVFVGIPVRRI